MKKWVFLGAPFIMLGALLAVSAVPGTGITADSVGLIRNIVYVLAGIGIVFGLIFAQTRMALISLVLGVAAYTMARHTVASESIGGEMLAALLITVVGPVMILVLHHSVERGPFTTSGIIRGAAVGTACGFLILAPESKLVTEWVQALPQQLTAPGPAGLPVVALGTALIAMIGLLIPRSDRSPFTGPILCSTVLCVLAAGTYSSEVWKSDIRQAVFFLLIGGAALSVDWGLLEQSWRNANLDQLTQLLGRRAMEGHLNGLGGRYSLAVVDIDHFKRINDKYGHDVGDQVLRYVAAVLRRFRPGTAYRYGGEEFVIVCKYGDTERAVKALDSLREAIRDRDFVVRSKERPRNRPGKSKTRTAKKKQTRKKGFRVAVSIGVACRSDKYPSSAQVFEAADKALYSAKKAGRNRVKKAP